LRLTNAPARSLVAFAAVFPVSDVLRSLDFCLGRLGFREHFRLGDPLSYGIDAVRRAGGRLAGPT